MTVAAREAVPNVALYNLRDSAGLTQSEVADALNAMAHEFNEAATVDGNHVSRWERGIVERPRPAHQRMLARLFNVSIEELGFTRPRAAGPARAGGGEVFDAASLGGSPVLADPAVDRSQQQWRQVRRDLNRRRLALADVAARLYDQRLRVSSTGLIAAPAWIPHLPVDLAEVDLAYDDDTPAPHLTGGEEQTKPLRPLATITKRYVRYSHAVRDVEQPHLFENRLSYRLLGLDTAGRRPRMRYGPTTYFDMVDVCEALAHETAQAHVRPGRDGVDQPSWRRLPFRRLIDDPFDLARRSVLPSTDTLTIRLDTDGATFVLHDRDAAKVALAGGQLHIMPAGVFQPSSVYPAAQTADFDLWRNIMREYSEEFLGNEEHDGDGPPIDYARDAPFRALEQARAAGQVRVFYLGTALDALTLAGELLTVAVFDANVYDRVFDDLVDHNTEGRVVRVGRTNPTPAIPFVESTIRQLIDDRRLAPAAAGCLHLAWQHRRVILDR